MIAEVLNQQPNYLEMLAPPPGVQSLEVFQGVYFSLAGSGAGAVSSVFGRVGAITAQSGDYAAFYEPGLGNPSSSGYLLSSTAAGVRSWVPAPVTGVTSWNTRTGAVVPATGDYAAAQVTNAVDRTQTYTDPPWITSLSWAKITGAPTTGVSSVFGRSGVVVATAGDYTAALVTNALDSTQFYPDPAWLTSLSWAKITGAPAFLTANQTITLSGDVTGSGTTLITTSYNNPLPASLAGVPTGGSAGQVLAKNSGNNYDVTWISGAGSVSSVSAGNLPPIFTTTVGSSTTTPAITFSLSGAAPHTFLGNNTGSTAAPAYVQPNFTDIAGFVATTQAGIPTGGAAGQVLQKNSTTNYDTGWINLAGGGNVSAIGTPSSGQLAQWTSATTIQGIASTTYELALGNPSVSGYVLSSTTAGVRSWVAMTGGSGAPGGATTQIQYNNAGAFGGISSLTFDGTIPATATLAPAAGVYATGLLLADVTAATSGNQQLSPSLLLRGQGWHTTTPGSAAVDFRLTSVPTQSTLATPQGYLEIGGNMGGGGFANPTRFNQYGQWLSNSTQAASGPTYSFISDSISGFYLFSTSDLAFATAGADRMRLNATHCWHLNTTIDVGGSEAAPGSRFNWDGAGNWNFLNGVIAGNWGTLKCGKWDGNNSTISDGLIIGHKSTTTPLAGIGTSLLFTSQDATVADQSLARIGAAWGVVTDASRTSYLDFQLVNNAAALASVARMFASGGFSVNNTTDPGAGNINLPTGGAIKVNNVRSTVPIGGAAGSFLGKNTATDFDMAWVSALGMATLQTPIFAVVSTTSTSVVMAGFGGAAGGTFTPTRSGNVVVIISGRGYNNTAAGTFSCNIRYGTGTAPVSGAAAVGTVIGNTAIGYSAAASASLPFTCSAIITGLTLGTPIWIDLGMALANPGGTMSLAHTAISAFELP